jgi:peptide/nickel transport system permease protein
MSTGAAPVPPHARSAPRFGALLQSLPHGFGFRFGLGLFAAIALAAIAAALVAPHDPYLQSLTTRLLPPVWDDSGRAAHLLGTDRLGRDVLSRVVHGARISLTIGFLAMAIGAVIGIALGTAAGFFRGRVDMVVNFLITVRLSIPVAIVALASVAVFGGSVPVVIAVLGALLWERFAVVARTTTLQLRDLPYIRAAEAIGASPWRIVARDVLPNITGPLTVIATQEFAHAVLMEATLSFLGFGVQAPLPSWGLMLAEGKQDILFAPWLVAIPGAALFLLVLSLNLMGDGLHRHLGAEDR